MLNTLFAGLFDSSTTTIISVGAFLLCVIVSLAIGAVMAFTYSYKTRYTQSFMITLALIPAVVCVVIMMVNGNVGAGVAVAGAFSLVRFRSVPGTAKEIYAIFLAMGAGIITGMGYLGYAVLFTLVLCGCSLLYTYLGFGTKKEQEAEKVLHITIPENLDYNDVFDEILEKYTEKSQLTNVKTTNMGSLFKLTYQIILKDLSKQKEFIDELRCRNGNLEIALSKGETRTDEL